MDWFKGKSEPETIDFPMKYGAFRLNFSNQSIEISIEKWSVY